MKKIILALSVCASLTLHARPVSSDMAALAASGFCGISTRSLTELELVSFGPSVKSVSGESQVSYYIFNRKSGGFVVVAGDDSARPVLAFSDEGRITADNIPDGMRMWLDGVARYVSELASDEEQVRHPAWNNTADLRTKAEGTSKTLTTAKWTQDAPYNNECPKDASYGYSRSKTGCVATAVAIILRYHEWPACAKTATIKDYSSNDYTIGDYQYCLSEIPIANNDVKNASTQVKANVARFMHDIGVMLKMQYGYYASGTNAERIIGALGEYMYMNKSATLESRSVYSADDWYKMMVEEIDAGRPVFYMGTQDNKGNDGHAFVLDGYDSANGMVHFNWGDGLTSGYYLSLSSNYMYNQVAIVGLGPDKEGTSSYTDGEFYWSERLSDTDKGISVKTPGTSGDPAKDKSFKLNLGPIQYTGALTFAGRIRLCLVDRAGTVKETLSSRAEYNTGGYYSKFDLYNFGPERNSRSYVRECKRTKLVYYGDKIIAEYVPDSDSEDWKPFKFSKYGTVVGELPIFPMFSIDLPESVPLNTYVDLTLCNGDDRYSGSIQWFVDDKRVFNASSVSSKYSSERFIYKFTTTGTHTVKAVIGTGATAETIVAKVVAE